jgi:hypothetical protein
MPFLSHLVSSSLQATHTLLCSALQGVSIPRNSQEFPPNCLKGNRRNHVFFSFIALVLLMGSASLSPILVLYVGETWMARFHE